MSRRFQAAALTATLLIAGCASGPQAAADDPYENFNRKVYGFNEGVDKAVLEPAAKGYRAVTNKPIRKGVKNVLLNLGEPVTFVNEVLQGDLGGATETVGRFSINSTVGLVGLIDLADDFGLERKKEDFGQTLAVWGVDDGPYLVAPLIGPTNPRDLTGALVDRVFSPFTWSKFEGDDIVTVSRITAGALSGRESVIEVVDELRTQQADPYTAMRRVYVQNRQSEIRNGAEDPNAYENLPSYDDYDAYDYDEDEE